MEKETITNETWTEIQGNLFQELLINSPKNEKLNKRFGSCDTLFHYTSLNGFISIIETQSFYCTNVNFLNDSKEFKYGEETILKAVENLKTNENSSILEKIKNNIELQLKSDKYVTCFSKEGDSLSQWRAYGNDGKGISLGFEFSDLTESFDKYLTGSHIEYDEKTQLEIIEEFIRLIIEFYKKIEDKYNWNGQDFNNLVSKVIIKFLNNVIHTYKHPSFIDEKEYRLQLEIDGNLYKKGDFDILFKSSENLIIPYTIIKNSYSAYLETKEPNETEPIFGLKRLPLNKIIIGPNLSFDIVKIGLEQFLTNKGYENVEIIKSEVPYRK
ncbi:DUF2971 domain-containing protein [Thalassobellus suaedae]|uniref:DUF2971 domain-containing protein n=1 Tax=Thalassobellus suaedae TaxID=3074124 RepID=A0ABY9XQS0_9FLAO|nr:DUF2971 domain-containing protein [Flavobacteriaceae bacterium HL-DH14]